MQVVCVRDHKSLVNVIQSALRILSAFVMRYIAAQEFNSFTVMFMFVVLLHEKTCCLLWIKQSHML
jgi:hypothetical protein